jgi:hypothetical protein
MVYASPGGLQGVTVAYVTTNIYLQPSVSSKGLPFSLLVIFKDLQ